MLTQANGQTITIPLTVSLGVAGLPSDATTEESLLSAADEALYIAKRMGRNRAVQYGRERLDTIPLDRREE